MVTVALRVYQLHTFNLVTTSDLWYFHRVEGGGDLCREVVVQRGIF